MACNLTFVPTPPCLGKGRYREGPLGSYGALRSQRLLGALEGAGPRLGLPQMQYTFIYQALLEYYLYGDTELDVSSLEKHLQTLHGTSTPFDKIGLEEEFRVSTRLPLMKMGGHLKKATSPLTGPEKAGELSCLVLKGRIPRGLLGSSNSLCREVRFTCILISQESGKVRDGDASALTRHA